MGWVDLIGVGSAVEKEQLDSEGNQTAWLAQALVVCAAFVGLLSASKWCWRRGSSSMYGRQRSQAENQQSKLDEEDG